MQNRPETERFCTFSMEFQCFLGDFFSKTNFEKTKRCTNPKVPNIEHLAIPVQSTKDKTICRPLHRISGQLREKWWWSLPPVITSKIYYKKTIVQDYSKIRNSIQFNSRDPNEPDSPIDAAQNFKRSDGIIIVVGEEKFDFRKQHWPIAQSYGFQSNLLMSNGQRTRLFVDFFTGSDTIMMESLL